MDSIIALNLIFAMERELGIRLGEEMIVRVKTLGDLKELAQTLVEPQHP